MSRLALWLIAFALTAAAVVICWAWIDRPLALWLHEHGLFTFGRGAFRPLTKIPDPLIPLGAAIFLVFGVLALAGHRLTRMSSVVVLCCFGVIASETIKNGLKWLFGRPWPDSWHGSEPSLIGKGAYAFHWFKGGHGYDAFPSGHMAAAAVVLTILWIHYRRLRPVCAVAGLGVAAALVTSNFHFLGDVIAGAFLGFSVGWMTATLFEQYQTMPRS